MASVVNLVKAYERFICLEWTPGLASAQKVMFAVYDPRDERRLRARLGEFEMATKRAKRQWLECDLTRAFAEWLGQHDYREAYFEDPSNLAIALEDFEEHVAARLRAALEAPEADARSVVAAYGVASLFGFMRVSRLVRLVQGSIRGRLLVFFPGQYEDGTYRLMDARDGWNYHAVPISE